MDIDSPNKPDTLEKKYIGISDVKGDLIGTDVHGSGNFIGKEIHYTVKGNVFHITSLSEESIQHLKKIIEINTMISSESSNKKNANTYERF